MRHNIHNVLSIPQHTSTSFSNLRSDVTHMRCPTKDVIKQGQQQKHLENSTAKKTAGRKMLFQ